MKRWVPNFITCLNLFFGCVAILYVLSGAYGTAFLFFVLSGVMDFLDGLAARALQVKSPMGKELDSLADMVSFGFLPAIGIYSLLISDPALSTPAEQVVIDWEALPAFLIAIFSALRLAMFNIDTRQTKDFIGLATPSAALFVMGILLIYEQDSFGLRGLISQTWFLYTLILGLCALLVSNIPMFSFKFDRFTWKGNAIRFIFAGAAVIMLLFLREAAFAVIVLFYILLNLLVYTTNKANRT